MLMGWASHRRSRAALVFLAGLAALPASAQESGNSAIVVPPPPPETEGAVGPRELRDFSLPGTVTRPADSPAAAPRRQPQPEVPPAARQPTAPAERPAATGSRPSPVERRSVTVPLPEPDPLAQPPTLAPPTAAPPGGAMASQPSFESAPPVIPPPPDDDQSTRTAWLLAALAILGLAGFAFRQQRRRTVFAGAGAPPLAEARPPMSQPLPRAAAPPESPAPARQPPQPSPAGGIVSTRLKPALELDFVPERLVLTDTGAVLHFACMLFNAGSAPARDVSVEAVLLNAGERQDEELAAFFQRPPGNRPKIAQIGPLEQLPLNSSAVMPREAIREYHVEGRRLLVPLIAFDVRYRSASGTTQLALSFLVGRGREGQEKLAPFRLDLGPRVFRDLARRRTAPVRAAHAKFQSTAEL